jgi:hypothetical protein
VGETKEERIEEASAATVSLARGVIGGVQRTRIETERASNSGENPKTLVTTQTGTHLVTYALGIVHLHNLSLSLVQLFLFENLN